MPTITKQKPTANFADNGKPHGAGASPIAQPGSLLARGVPVAELGELKRLTALFYGVNRCGKTSLACEFAKPLALVSFEPVPLTGGAASVVNVPGVTHFLVIPSTAAEKWPKGRQEPIVGIAGALALAEELSRDTHYKTVVVDGGTSLQDVALTEMMGLAELPAQMRVARSKDDRSWGVATSDQYMDRSAQTKEVLRKYLSLPKENVIILCKEKDHNPPRDDKGNVRRDKMTRGLSIESFIAADLGQATAGWLMDACDCVCRMYLAKEVREQKIRIAGTDSVSEVETGRIVRRLLTQLHPNFAAGVRSPHEVPEYIEGTTPKDLHDKFTRMVKGIRVK